MNKYCLYFDLGVMWADLQAAYRHNISRFIHWSESVSEANRPKENQLANDSIVTNLLSLTIASIQSRAVKRMSKKHPILLLNTVPDFGGKGVVASIAYNAVKDKAELRINFQTLKYSSGLHVGRRSHKNVVYD